MFEAFTILTVACALTRCPVFADEKKYVEEKEDPRITNAWRELEGRWLRVGLDSAQGIYADLSGDEFEFVISRRGVAVYAKGKLIRDEGQLRFEIDPTQKPAHLNMITCVKGLRSQSTLCIYRIENNKLQIVRNRVGNDRPASFDLIETDKNLPSMMEYKRVKDFKS